jgi:hypothetical protein
MNQNRTVSHLLRLSLLASLLSTSSALGDDSSTNSEFRWQPRHTRVFMVSMTKFKGGTTAPWGTKDRLDGALLDCLRDKGVANNNITFLTDEQADSDSIKQHFAALLSESSPNECLIFYFSSHGSYNAKSGHYSYLTYDGHLPFQWAFEAIEHNFKGARVLMFADCCYSGGIAELALQRKSPIKYACLSSTYSHNVGFSGWRFFDCVLRGFSGAPVVDLDGDGFIELDELARFSEEHMAFVAEGKPMFATTNDFNRRWIIADATGKKKSPEIGNYVEAWHGNKWHKAEITDVKPGYVQVRDADKGDPFVDWLAKAQIRPFRYTQFAKGDRVEVQGTSSSKWYPASVIDSWQSMHFCHFDGYSSAYNEWVGPSRIKLLSVSPVRETGETITSNFTGTWKGYWENNLGEKGNDSLILTEDINGNFEGIWTGNIPVRGRRLDANNVQLWAETSNRSYRLTCTLSADTMTLTYVAKRTDSTGSYEGKSVLTQVN